MPTLSPPSHIPFPTRFPLFPAQPRLTVCKEIHPKALFSLSLSLYPQIAHSPFERLGDQHETVTLGFVAPEMAWCYRPARLAVLAIVVACSRAPGGADAACKAAGQSCRTSGDVCQVGYFCRDWSGNGLGECQTNLQQGGYCDGGGNCNAGFYCFNRNLPHSKLAFTCPLLFSFGRRHNRTACTYTALCATAPLRGTGTSPCQSTGALCNCKYF